MSAQVDHDLLADYVGGALEGTPDQERVAALIASSPQWRLAADEMESALEAVAAELTWLRETPAEPMPEDVFARIESSLSATRDPLESRVINRGASRPRSRRWGRLAVPVGIAAAILGLSIVILPKTDFAPSMPAMKDAPGSSERLNQAEVPAPQVAADASAVPTTATGNNYTRETVAQATPPSGNSFRSGSSNGSTMSKSGTPPDLAACLTAVNRVLPGPATLIDYALFEDKPALVISITFGGQPWRFVAGYACGRPGPDELFKTPLK